MTQRGPRILGSMAVLGVLWAAAGCGGGGVDGPDDAEVVVSDNGPVDPGPGSDARPDDDGPAPDEGPATDDGPAADLPPVGIPWAPPPPAEPLVDEPYLQEFNHTIFEVDPALVPLVGVTLRPAGFPGEGPVQVTPRGMAWEKLGGTWTFRGPAEGEPDVIAAAAGVDGVVLAAPDRLWEVAANGSVTTSTLEGTTLLGLDSSGGAVYARTDRGLGQVFRAQALLPEDGAPGTAATARGIYLLLGHEDGTVTFHPMTDAGPAGPETARLGPADGLPPGAVRALITDVTLPQAMDLVVVSDGGIVGLRLFEDRGWLVPPLAEPVAEPLFAANRVPLDAPRAAARTPDGGFVVATAGGAYRVMERGDGPEWRVYGAQRWLPSEDVRGVAVDPTVPLAPVYFATAGGLGTVTAKRTTLEEKMAMGIERIVLRHDRDGAVADSRLAVQGDLSTSVPWDSDNDGSWTAYWLMAECARWKVTGAADAKAHFDKALDAMLFLRDVTGTDWFIARSVIRKEGCVLDDCDDPDDGHWYTSADGKWWIKRDTSNDELFAHLSMMAFVYEPCADESQKQRIRAHMSGIFGGLIDHGYQLIDPVTNEVTTYGQMDPAYVNEWIAGVYGDGGLRAALVLGGMTVTYEMTGDERFAEAKRWLIEEQGYADAAETEIEHIVRPLSMDNDEMSSWGWWTLFRYERDPVLRERWKKGWSGVYDTKLERQQGAWWALGRATTGFDDLDPGRDLLRWLRLAPVDLVRWNQHNSHRKDLVKVTEPFDEGGGLRSDGRILPYDERRCDRWNTDQYRLDGGMDGRVEMDGAEILLCYWYGRMAGLIVPAP